MTDDSCSSSSEQEEFYPVAPGPGKNMVAIREKTLSVGVFFDGTCNNKNNGIPSTKTNVAKLWEAYKDGMSQDNAGFAKIYIRGVGSKIYIDEDREIDDLMGVGASTLGAAFGMGGEQRISFTLNKLAIAINNYKSQQQKYPHKVKLDVFGFSRGAALARHFVNRIYSHTYTLPAQCPLAKGRITVGFVGVFDTVGSFNWPGNDDDGGYQFHISTNKAECTYHLVSEDEIRENFDVQTMKSDGNEVLDEASAQSQPRWIVEEEYPGVHSDIGGGYMSPEEKSDENDSQGKSNHLARIYLHKMYHKALSAGVPLLRLVDLAADTNIWQHWEVSGDVQGFFDDLMQCYGDRPGLQQKHKIFRTFERKLEYYNWEIENYRTNGSSASSRDAIEVLTRIRDDHQTVRIDALKNRMMSEHFSNDPGEFDSFLGTAIQLREDYIHSSHYPMVAGAANYISNQPQWMDIDSSAWPLQGTSSQFLRNFMDGSCDDFHKNTRTQRVFRREVFYPTHGAAQYNESLNTYYFTCYLKVVVKENSRNGKPLPAGVCIEAWDSNGALDSECLGVAVVQPNTNGQVNLLCHRPRYMEAYRRTLSLFNVAAHLQGEPDVFFVIRGQKKRVHGMSLPACWSSKTRVCLHNPPAHLIAPITGYNGWTPGFIEDLSRGTTFVGTPDNRFEITMDVENMNDEHLDEGIGLTRAS